MTGLDADVCAFEVAADPVPLSALGEALARIEGRWTWELCQAGGRLTLDRRDSWDIAARVAGTFRGDVLREHRCGSAPPLASPSAFSSTAADRLPPGSPAPF